MIVIGLPFIVNGLRFSVNEDGTKVVPVDNVSCNTTLFTGCEIKFLISTVYNSVCPRLDALWANVIKLAQLIFGVKESIVFVPLGIPESIKVYCGFFGTGVGMV